MTQFAVPVPHELARVGTGTRVRRIYRYIRDPYYFATVSISHGTNQLPALIPATGPGAAGSTFPTKIPEVELVEIQVTGTLRPDEQYGSNLGRPAGVGANLPGGI